MFDVTSQACCTISNIDCSFHSRVLERIWFMCVSTFKTNYLAARNKHITNYQFFPRKVCAHCDTCSSLSASHIVPSTVRIVKMWKYHWRVSNAIPITKLTEAIVKWRKIIIIIYFFGKTVLHLSSLEANTNVRLSLRAHDVSHCENNQFFELPDKLFIVSTRQNSKHHRTSLRQTDGDRERIVSIFSPWSRSFRSFFEN